MEVLVFTACYRPRPNIRNLTIVDEVVPPLQRTLVSLSIMALSMVPHITLVCKSAGFFFTWSA